MEEKVFTRKELYDALWAEPATALLKKYNLSVSGLKKICSNLRIPRPENGHWMKIQFGKEVPIHLLPSDYSGEQTVTLKVKREGEQGSIRVSTPLSVLKNEIEKEAKLSLVVPQKLSHPDKLIIAAKENLAENRTPAFNGLVHTWRGRLSIRVSPTNVSRALRFMDALIKNFRNRGHLIRVDNNSCITIQGEEFKMGLREKLKRTAVQSEQPWQKYEWSPTGILIFSISESYPIIEWRDGKKMLEDQLSEIIAGLELRAKERKEERRTMEAFWAEQKRERQIREEIEQKKQKELADFKLLLKESEQWSQAKALRNYIDVIEAKANESNSMSEELKNWLAWARKKAVEFDPLSGPRR